MKTIVILLTIFWICFGIAMISCLPAIDTPREIVIWILCIVLSITGTFLGCVLYNKLDKKDIQHEE